MKKYISVLLAVLVFVLGMIGGMTEAAILNSSDVDKLNSKISSDATSGLFDDDVICSYKVDGAKDFKEEKSKNRALFSLRSVRNGGPQFLYFSFITLNSF